VERDRLALAVAVAALVPSIYGASLPPLATVRGLPSDAAHIHSAEKSAGFTAAGIVIASAIVSGSGEVLIIAGGMAAAYAYLYHNARKADD
jgi:hypothetical protein